MTANFTVYYGPVINPQSLSSFGAYPNCLICVGSTGDIDWIVRDVPDYLVQETMMQQGCAEAEVFDLKSGQFLMPGFIDTHTHAPQFPNLGTGGKYALLDWLENLTFPMESQFKDLKFAESIYKSVVRRTLDAGVKTTTCCYYGTNHLEATKLLADIIYASGQRAFVGKCNMDRNSPDHYREPSAEQSILDTKAFIQYCHDHYGASSAVSLVLPILTPRFAISCTSELLASLGSLATSDSGLRIQTHISENKSEVALVKELFPSVATYASVYDSFGLLRDNTILAHGVLLDDSEIDLIKRKEAGISHCPTSNFNLNSGLAPVGKYLDKGIKIGLGTDVSGGYSPSILTAIQHASIASKTLALQSQHSPPATSRYADKPLTLPALLYLATLGGAEVCSLADRVGSFEQGKAFDALLVDIRPSAGNLNFWSVSEGKTVTEDDLSSALERFFFCGDDRNISRVFVQGKCVGGMNHHA